VGKTVESYRMALEDEINQWRGFQKPLRIEDKEAFEALMDACRSFASAGSNATNPILFKPMVMSILLSPAKKIARLEKIWMQSNRRPKIHTVFYRYTTRFWKIMLNHKRNGHRLKTTFLFNKEGFCHHEA
jgi:hypothetical protein